MANGSALMLMLTYYETVLCWLWTKSRYVGISTCLNLSVSILGIRYTMHYDTIIIPRSPAIQLLFQCHMGRRWCLCWLNVRNGIMLAFDEQWVRWYLCMFEFECVITWCTIHHERHDCDCTLACYYSTTMAMTNIRLCADVDWIYGTVSCWLSTNRTYVGIGACLDLNASLRVPTMHGNNIWLYADVDVD